MHFHIPDLGAVYRLHKSFTVCVIECNRCDQHTILTLIGEIPAVCLTCGTEFKLLATQWHYQNIAENRVGIGWRPTKVQGEA